jgi:DNA-binding NarL/FixJ family response regulator
MNRIVVMIIDEHPAVRQSLGAFLNAIPEVEVMATTAFLEEGEALAQSTHPDVVLLGLRSYYDSMAPLKVAVTRFSQKGVAVIVLSPYPDKVEKEMFYQAGAKHYLLKDIDTSHLLAAIRDAISSS